MLYGLVVLVIIVIFAVLIYSSQLGINNKASSYIYQPVPSSLISNLFIPNNISNAIGVGGAQNFPMLIKSTTPLTLGNKPEILYLGGEYCPYCAAERWAIVIALMRFGNFSGLEYMTSSSKDAFPNTPTFTFLHANYSSPYVAFVSVEASDRNGSALQKPTPQQNAVAAAYDTAGTIPFIDFANYSVIGSVTYSPRILQGLNWSQVTSALKYTNSSVAQGVIGAANLITAQICKINNNTPQKVCSQNYVQQIENQIK